METFGKKWGKILKRRHKAYVVIFLLVFGFIFISSSGYAENEAIDSKIECKILTEIDSEMKVVEKRFEDLKKQNEDHINQRFQSYFEQIKDLFDMDRKSFDRMISKITYFAWAIYVLLVVIIIFLGLRNYSVKKDIEDQIKRNDQRLEELMHFASEVKEKQEELKTYEKELKDLTASYEKQIVFIREHKDLNFQYEIDKIKERGFNNIKSILCDEVKSLKHQDCDIMLYYFDYSTEKLDTIFEFLKQDKKERIPLLIYNFKTNQIPKEYIIEYRNYIYANLPLSLMSHFKMIIRLY
jgi:cell division protein FtsL